MSTGRYLLLTGLVPLKNGQKKATESVHRKLLHPEAGREGVAAVNLFSPLLPAAVPKANKACRAPDRSQTSRESCRNLFLEKSATTLYSTRELRSAYIRGYALATTVNIFCTYYYCQSSSSRRCGSDLENKMKSEHSLC